MINKRNVWLPNNNSKMDCTYLTSIQNSQINNLFLDELDKEQMIILNN